MASSNPTTGVGVAAYVQVTGTGITGIGAGSGSSNHPVAQYSLSLSLAGTSTCQLTAVLKDVANTTVTSANGNSASYNSASTGVATVSGSGLISAVAKGQTIVEVRFPTFDSTLNVAYGKVYVQIIVTVTA